MRSRNRAPGGKAKIAAGAFYIECNSFAPGVTTIDQFRVEGFALGSEITRDSAWGAAEFAGAYDFFDRNNVELVPTLVAAASPAPPISHSTFEEIRDEMVSRIPVDIDGIYLMLHGSAYCREVEDPEGAILTAIRSKVGPRPFIAISMDLHAHYTQEMDAAVDIAVAYKTCPHVDLYETGQHAARLLLDAVEGKISPFTFVCRIPMVTPPENHNNEFPPYGDLMQICKELEREGAYAASLLTVQPWLNVPDLGWKALIVADQENFDGARAAERLASAAWARRSELLTMSGIPKATALQLAVANENLTVFADLGDATNGGSYGDSTELLRQTLLLNSPTNVLLSITDPDLVAQLYFVEFSELTAKIGSGEQGQYNEQVKSSIKILSRKNETIQYTHPAAEGAIGNPGKSLLIQIENYPGKLMIVVHENPVRVIDPSIYRLFDLDVKDFDVVQAKSHVSFKAGFEAITKNYVLADTLGPTAANLKTLNFDRRTIPTLPFDEMS